MNMGHSFSSIRTYAALFLRKLTQRSAQPSYALVCLSRASYQRLREPSFQGSLCCHSPGCYLAHTFSHGGEQLWTHIGPSRGHTAKQIPHDAVSAKHGMHLSKSAYHRSTPRTICLFSVIAPGGTCARADLASLAEIVCAKGLRADATGSMSVVMLQAHTRSELPGNQRAMLAEFSQAGIDGRGIVAQASAPGPSYGLALYPCKQIQLARAYEARVPRAY